MRVIDLINNSKTTAFSFEILPPLKGNSIDLVYKTIDLLRPFDPKYINITTHRSEIVYKETGPNLFQRVAERHRPGTVAIAAAIQNKYKVNVVPHMICSGFSKSETEYALIDLQFLGITDLLVLRGDKAKHDKAFIPGEEGHGTETFDKTVFGSNMQHHALFGKKIGFGLQKEPYLTVTLQRQTRRTKRIFARIDIAIRQQFAEVVMTHRTFIFTAHIKNRTGSHSHMPALTSDRCYLPSGGC